MNVDFVNRLRNTKLAARHALLPVFEAVVNSIHAIQDRDLSSGEIDVVIERASDETIQDLHGNTIAPIVRVIIIDNGVGFTEDNYAAFQTLDTSAKASRGGRGVGRLLWLKAFNEALIDSTYSDNGRRLRRVFAFRPTSQGTEGMTVNEVPVGEAPAFETRVSLEHFKSPYREAAPKSADAFAHRLLEHLVEYFLHPTCPTITVSDSNDNARVNLNEMFLSEYNPTTEKRSFLVGNEELEIRDVLLRTPGECKHVVNLCAHNRTVHQIDLAKAIPHLEAPLRNADGDPLVYHGYVTGGFLDEAADPDRTAFRIDRRDELPLQSEVSWEDLVDAVRAVAAEYLRPKTEEARQLALTRVQEFVESKRPKYRALLAHRQGDLETLSLSMSEERLDLELYKIQNRWRQEVHESTNRAICEAEATPDGFAAHEEQFRSLLGDLQEVAKSDLAEYVIHRAAVLTFFERLLGTDSGGTFYREENVHDLLFPRRTTSDDIDYNDHNLWVLDERLAYHRYLASDVRFRSQEGPVEVASEDRPDILIYNVPLAFWPGEMPMGSIVVIEFKRPERNEYDEETSPIRQVLNYVDQIRQGRARRSDRSTIEMPGDIPFYCHVVATLTPRLISDAKERGFTLAPDGLGYFNYNQNYRAYIEVSSFRKVLEDAKKRNRAFFDRLQIPLP